MNFEQVKELIEQVDASSLRVFELDNESVSIKMSKNDGPLTITEQTAAPVSSQQSQQEYNTKSPEKPQEQATVLSKEDVQEVPEDVSEVTAPIVGTAYLSPAPDQDPFIKVGDYVQKGQALLIVEAMKVMNEIKSDVDGEVVNILVEDGQPIEFGQPLIQIK